jgi:predicted acetyltransferase
MEIDLRTCRDDELAYFLTTVEAAFGYSPKEEEIQRFGRILDMSRTIGAFDGESMIGTAADFEFTLTVPGGKLPTAGVTMVGVLPSHRRRGALTRMMHKQLENIHERGEPLAALWASEGNIYQRFGYGVATLYSRIDIDRSRTGFRNEVPSTGRVRLVDGDKIVDILEDVYRRVADRTPGMFERSREWWEAHRLADPEDDRDGGGPMFKAVWEIDGRAEGYALYRIHQSWEQSAPAGYLHVLEAVGATPIATREIWRFLFGVDLVARITAYFQPALHPLLFMLAEPRRLRAALADALFVRVVDLKAALEARSYGAEGSVVLDVRDPLFAHNDGRWKLEVTSSNTQLTRTKEPADLSLAINDAGTLYLGGFRWSQLVQSGTVHEEIQGAAWRADEIFRTETEPWCPEVF